MLELLRELAAEQGRQREELAAIRRLLARGRGARDAADVALLVAIAEAIGDRDFTCRLLWAHGQADPALREAFEAADITNTQELGCVFRRLQGTPLAGFRLEYVGASPREGNRWQVRVCEVEPRIVAAVDTSDHEH